MGSAVHFAIRRSSEPVKDVLCDRVAAAQMFVHDAFEQCVVDVMIPNPLGIDDEQWSTATDTQTGRRPAFDAIWILVAGQVAEQARQAAEESMCKAFGIAIRSGTHDNVTTIGLHFGGIIHSVTLHRELSVGVTSHYGFGSSRTNS